MIGRVCQRHVRRIVGAGGVEVTHKARSSARSGDGDQTAAAGDRKKQSPTLLRPQTSLTPTSNPKLTNNGQTPSGSAHFKRKTKLLN